MFHCASGFQSVACPPPRAWRLHAAQLPGRVGVPKLGVAVLAADVDAFNLLLEMKLKRRRERPHLPRTVTELVAEDGSRVYVVGTAHFSDDSKKDVVKVSRHTAAPQAGPWPLPLPPDPTAARRAQALRPHSLPARRRPAVGPPF